MRKWIIAWALSWAGVALLPSSAVAQDGPTAGAALGNTGGGDVQYQKETEYDFEGDDVEGALVKPDGENIEGQTKSKTSSLIRIRRDFIPEMIKSVENL